MKQLNVKNLKENTREFVSHSLFRFLWKILKKRKLQLDVHWYFAVIYNIVTLIENKKAMGLLRSFL